MKLSGSSRVSGFRNARIISMKSAVTSLICVTCALTVRGCIMCWLTFVRNSCHNLPWLKAERCTMTHRLLLVVKQKTVTLCSIRVGLVSGLRGSLYIRWTIDRTGHRQEILTGVSEKEREGSKGERGRMTTRTRVGGGLLCQLVFPYFDEFSGYRRRSRFTVCIARVASRVTTPRTPIFICANRPPLVIAALLI